MERLDQPQNIVVHKLRYFVTGVIVVILLIAGGIFAKNYKFNDASPTPGTSQVPKQQVQTPTNFVFFSLDGATVNLPGDIYNTPIPLVYIQRSEAKWDTPVNAMISQSSAMAIKDIDWEVESWAEDDQDRIRQGIVTRNPDDPVQKQFEKYVETQSMEIVGEVSYQQYQIVLTGNKDFDGLGMVVFKNTSTGWRASDDLIGDPIWGMISLMMDHGAKIGPGGSVVEETRVPFLGLPKQGELGKQKEGEGFVYTTLESGSPTEKNPQHTGRFAKTYFSKFGTETLVYIEKHDVLEESWLPATIPSKPRIVNYFLIEDYPTKDNEFGFVCYPDEKGCYSKGIDPDMRVFIKEFVKDPVGTFTKESVEIQGTLEFKKMSPTFYSIPADWKIL